MVFHLAIVAIFTPDVRMTAALLLESSDSQHECCKCTSATILVSEALSVKIDKDIVVLPQRVLMVANMIGI
jgi:hypothetical protein